MSEEPQKPELGKLTPPPPTLISLIEGQALQALMFVGKQPEPRTGRLIVNLSMARHNLEVLKMLKAKTEGNRDEEEEKTLSRYIELVALAVKNALEEHPPAEADEGEDGA